MTLVTPSTMALPSNARKTSAQTGRNGNLKRLRWRRPLKIAKMIAQQTTTAIVQLQNGPSQLRGMPPPKISYVLSMGATVSPLAR